MNTSFCVPLVFLLCLLWFKKNACKINHKRFFIMYAVYYNTPCAIIAFATFMKPAMFAPFT
jgi:hypothetical protein